MAEKTGEALCGSLSSIQENVMLTCHPAGHLSRHESGPGAEALLQKAPEMQRSAGLVRHAAMNHKNQAGSKPEQAEAKG